jgi:hypothetical protein
MRRGEGKERKGLRERFPNREAKTKGNRTHTLYKKKHTQPDEKDEKEIEMGKKRKKEGSC